MAGETDVDYTKLASQNGTLDNLGKNLDLAVFDGTLTAEATLPATVSLENKLSILAVTLKNSDGTSDVTSGITSLKITDYTNTYNVSPSAAAGPIYVAIKPTTSATIGVMASDGTANYCKSLAAKTYDADNGNTVSWKMDKGVCLAFLTAAYTAQNGETLTGSGSQPISIAAGASITLKDATINGGLAIQCSGAATINLEGTNSVKSNTKEKAGIQAGGEGTTLTIQGEGSLTATGAENGAGIGASKSVKCGNITISSGTVTAIGSWGAAGIGGAYWETGCGDITIIGGTVTATGGQNSAGIGSSNYKGDCVAINISGGKVEATGGNNGAGIGSGSNMTSCGDITISGGTVVATGGSNGAGSGNSNPPSSCGNINISGGTVEATGGKNGAGIGTGWKGTCGAIAITSGVTSVTATKGNTFAQSIGAGWDGTCGTKTIDTGANVTQN